MHRVIFEELTRGIIDDHSRQEYLRIMRDLVERGAQGIVLGCTEISLLVAAEDMSGTALYDTTALHVDRAVRISLGLHPPSQIRSRRLADTPRRPDRPTGTWA